MNHPIHKECKIIGSLSSEPLTSISDQLYFLQITDQYLRFRRSLYPRCLIFFIEGSKYLRFHQNLQKIIIESLKIGELLYRLSIEQ